MEKTNRRAFVGGAVLTGAAATAGAAAEVAGAATNVRKLSVEIATTAFDSVRQPATGKMVPTGPYYAAGDIYRKGTLKSDGSVPPGARKIGTYRCHGWIYDDTTAENLAVQTFILNRRGEIDVVGREPGLAAIAGGTGSYRNSRGSCRVGEISETAMSAAFNIIG